MKVLALVSDAFGGHGGIALYNRNVLKALCEHASRPHVVAIPRLVPRPPGSMPDNLEFRVGATGGKSKFVLETARALARHRRFDLIVASHVNLLPLAFAVRALSPSPLLLFIYGIDAWWRRSWLTETLVPRIDGCVSIRTHTLERMRTWVELRCPTFVLENAIDLDRYGPGPKRADLVGRFGLENKRVLLTLSRVDDPNFGVDEVLDVLGDLVKAVPDLVYLVAGDGKELARVRQKARSLGVDRHVVFAGYVDERDKPDYYRLGDAFAMPGSHPTEFDRYPLRFSFLEAMACGLPVVASRPEELKSDGDSPLPNIYVDPTDRESIKAGVLEALGRGAGEVPRALHRYGYDSFRRRLHDIVDAILNAPPTPAP